MDKNLQAFTSLYKEIKNNLNLIIKDYNESLVSNSSCYLKENLEYFKDLNSEGKCIRGFLISLGYKILKNNINYSYHLSLAYEIFQTSVLIHDDIIDNDNLRRGKNTIHYSNYLCHLEGMTVIGDSMYLGMNCHQASPKNQTFLVYNGLAALEQRYQNS